MPTSRNNSPPLDIIEFFQKKSPAIFDIVSPLYKKGLSITDIADQTGLTRYSIWKCLKTHSQELRSQDSVPFDRWRTGRGKTKARPPFGYTYHQGEVIQDPKEYPTLQLIQNLGKQGASIGSIVDRLNSKGIRSRMNKSWSYNVIKSILKRAERRSLDRLAARSKPTNKKIKPREVDNES